MQRTTIDDWIAWGDRIFAKCQSCQRDQMLDLAALRNRLGGNFVCVGNPNPLAAKLRCKSCGGRDIGLMVLPATVPTVRGR